MAVDGLSLWAEAAVQIPPSAPATDDAHLCLTYPPRRRAQGGAWSRAHAASNGSASVHVRACGCQARPSSRRRARASLTLLGLAATACGLSPTLIAATTGCALEWARLSRSHSRAVRLAVVSRRCRQPASARVWSSSPRDGARSMMRQVRAGTPAASSDAAPINSTRAFVHGRVITRSSTKREGFARLMRTS